MKAYYTAVEEFVKNNLPPEGVAEWHDFIETRCRCW
jgi:hypothetical protein